MPPLQGAADDDEHVVDADLLHLRWVLGTQDRADVGDAVQVRVGGEIGLLHCAGGVELGQLLVRVLAGLGNVVAHAVQLAVVAQVHLELGQGDVLRQPRRVQDDAEQAQPHAANPCLHRTAGAV